MAVMGRARRPVAPGGKMLARPRNPAGHFGTGPLRPSAGRDAGTSRPRQIRGIECHLPPRAAARVRVSHVGVDSLAREMSSRWAGGDSSREAHVTRPREMRCSLCPKEGEQATLRPIGLLWRIDMPASELRRKTGEGASEPRTD